jgi:hypothetical protein
MALSTFKELIYPHFNGEISVSGKPYPCREFIAAREITIVHPQMAHYMACSIRKK